MKSKKDSGFTLYEILVAIAITALLLTIVMRSVSSARSKTRDARRVDNIKTIQGAIENYFATCFSYPATLDVLQVSGSCAGYVPSLAVLPTDPVTYTNYSYFTDVTPPVTGKRYHLCATVENSYVNKGKVSKAPFVAGDPCNGTNATTFDVAGGIY